MIKKILTSFFLISLSVSIPICIPSCGEKSSTQPNNSVDATVLEKIPTNSYYIGAEIVSFGGIKGCTKSEIRDSTLTYYIKDAEIQINSTQCKYDSTFNIYLPDSTQPQLSYLPGTAYSLTVTRGGKIIATGHAIMPSTPYLTNITKFPFHHRLNQPLHLEWATAMHATAIEVQILKYVADTSQTSINPTVLERFRSVLLPPTQNTYEIAGNVFDTTVQYSVTINAFHGLPDGLHRDSLEGPPHNKKGFNIDSSAGYFVALNSWGMDTDFVIVLDTVSN